MTDSKLNVYRKPDVEDKAYVEENMTRQRRTEHDCFLEVTRTSITKSMNGFMSRNDENGEFHIQQLMLLRAAAILLKSYDHAIKWTTRTFLLQMLSS